MTLLLSALSLSCPSLAQPPTREIKITAAVSTPFKSDPDWEKDIRDRIQFASQIFEPQFGLHFSVKNFAGWEPEDETREMGLLMEELRSLHALDPGSVVMGFHKMSRPLESTFIEDIETVGSAQFFRGYAVMRDPANPLPLLIRQVILTHEIAHLFGAVHVNGEREIMHASASTEPLPALDADNREIIRLTRDVDFQKGMDSLNGDAIDGLIHIYERLIRQNPASDFYHQLGAFYKKRGQPARAVSIWEEAIRYHYDHPHIHRELGFHYYESGRYDLAIRELGSAIAHFILPSQKKDRAQALNFLGVAYYEKGNVEQAVFAWLKGLASDPDSPDLQGNLAAAYLVSGDVDRAVTELEKLAAKNPDDATTLSNLGVALMRKKDDARAVEMFQRALQKPSLALADAGEDKGRLLRGVSEAEIRLNLGGAYLDMNRPAEAVTQLEKSRVLAGDNFDVHRNLAQAYLVTKSYENAVNEVKEALRYKKDDPYLYSFLGQAYAETGNIEEAIRVAREGILYASDELAASLHKNIAGLLANQGNYTEAIAELRESLNKNWKDPETHARLGEIYFRAGHLEDAKRSLETALRMDPNHQAAKEALESLKTTR